MADTPGFTSLKRSQCWGTLNRLGTRTLRAMVRERKLLHEDSLVWVAFATRRVLMDTLVDVLVPAPAIKREPQQLALALEVR